MFVCHLSKEYLHLYNLLLVQQTALAPLILSEVWARQRCMPSARTQAMLSHCHFLTGLLKAVLGTQWAHIKYGDEWAYWGVLEPSPRIREFGKNLILEVLLNGRLLLTTSELVLAQSFGIFKLNKETFQLSLPFWKGYILFCFNQTLVYFVGDSNLAPIPGGLACLGVTAQAH